jgi:hypothetical protein
MVKWSIGAIVLSLLMIVLFGDDPEEGGTPKIASISKEIYAVSRSNDYLNVDVALGVPWDGAGSIFQASDMVLKTMKRIKAGAPDAGGPGLKAVQFTFSVPTRSPLGEEGRGDLVNIQISAEVLEAANPDKMRPFDVMEVAKVEIPSRIGRDALTDYCADQGKFSPRFCSQLAMGLL